MRKFRGVVLIVIAFISCFVFSACGKDYSSLKMSFYSSDGESISNINLILDENDTATIGVKFEGIETDDIGSISARTEPANLADTPIGNLEGNTYFITISANMVSSDNARLIVHHDSSGKEASIPLSISKRSTNNGISLINENYFLPIKGEEYTAIIDPYDIISIDGSEDVYFALSDNSNMGALTSITESINGEELITGFTVPNTIQTGFKVDLIPVLVLNQDTNRHLTDYTFSLNFVRQFNESEIVIDTDQLHEPYINNKPIVLIAGDTDSNLSPDGESYNYNNVHVELKLMADELIDLTNVDGVNFYNYYTVKATYDDSLPLRVEYSANKVIFTATDYFADETDVKLELIPKGNGQVESIVKSFKIKCAVKPNNIEIAMQDEIIDTDSTLSLFDYYPNSLGAKFDFSVMPEIAYSDLSNIRLQVTPQLLNIRVNFGNDNVNVIYTDDSFTTLNTNTSVTHNDGTVTQFGDNMYLLQFYKGSTPLKFYYDAGLNKFVSEEITENDVVFVKYVETDSIVDRFGTLMFDVCNYYSGDLDYLQNIKTLSKTLTFNRRDGVSDLTINAGYISIDGNHDQTFYQNAEGSIEVKQLYLDRNQGIDNPNATTYFIYVKDVLGEQGNNLTSATFDVKVVGGGDNPLKVKQYAVNDGNAKDIVGQTEIKFNYTSELIYNDILLVFDSNTDIGDYEIYIYFPNYDGGENGFVKIDCKVYQSLTEKDIEYVIEQNDTAFKNFLGFNFDGTKQYLFDEYQSDYIVASGQELNFAIDLDEVYEVESYLFTADYTGGGNYTANEFISIKNNGANDSSAKLSFVKGSFVDGIQYVTLHSFITVENYSNIVTIDGTNTIELALTFFIYEPISLEDIKTNITIDGQTIKASSETRYMNECLGAYYKNLSVAELSIALSDESLWNYVLKTNSNESTDDNNEDVNTEIPTENPTETSGDNTSENENAEGDTGSNENNNQNPIYVTWSSETDSDLVEILSQDYNSIELKFNNNSSYTAYSVVIYATFVQFNQKPFTLIFTINVEVPVLTEHVQILSELEEIIEGSTDYSLNLKAGEVYTLTAKNIAGNREVTSPEVYMVVVDRFGNVSTNNVTVDNENLTLTVNDNLLGGNDLKLIVFAKDVLSENLEHFASGYNDPKTFILNGWDATTEGSFYEAYIVIDLILSNGTISHPYMIYNADDFWEINYSDAMKSANYKLVANINLNNTTYLGPRVIDGFSGSISTYVDDNDTEYMYTISGLTLDENNRNLFTNFLGSISNINFNVLYNYNLSLSKESEKLGIFATNEGSIVNTTVTFTTNSSANLVGSDSTINFGGLVGENYGEIKYTSNIIIGASGSITLTGNANVNFGGLVGLNSATISGYSGEESALNANSTDTTTDSNNKNIIFGIFIGNDGAIANVNIISNMTNNNSSLGGVIGENEIDASISNAFVTGNIDATHNNVGGVIGRNLGVKHSVLVALDGTTNNIIDLTVQDNNVNYSVYKVTSIVKIASTGDNIGGVTGIDTNGIYSEVKYQIMSDSARSIVGGNNVAGIIGNATNSYLEYSSVYSYRWDYASCSAIEGEEDISGYNYVSGLIGLSNDGVTNVSSGAKYAVSSVNKSSVNAYISGEGNTSGIISVNISSSVRSPLIIYSSFIGKLTGANTQNRLVVSNIDNTSLLSNQVFSVNGIFENSDTFNWTIKNPSELNSDVWGYNAGINGGYIYIMKDGEPIFDRVPSDITATPSDKVNSFEDNVIYLEYYNFMNGEDSSITIRENTYSILDILNFTISPSDLDNVRINVVSSNSNVVMISNSNILVRGIGQATITFSAQLNEDINTSVTIYVGLPLGNIFNISRSSVDSSLSINNTDLRIAKDNGEQFYIISSGEEDYLGNTYSYETNKNVNLHIEVSTPASYNIDGSSEDGHTNINYYLNISGINLTYKEEKDTYDIWEVDLSYDTLFSIFVLNKLEGGKFAFSVTPFIMVAEQYRLTFDKNVVVFDLYTRSGPTSVSLNYNSLILYPNDETTLSAYISTDVELDETDFRDMLNLTFDNVVVNTGDYDKYIDILSLGSLNENTNQQIVTFSVKFNKDDSISETTTHSLDLSIDIENGNSAKVEFTLIPQRINTLDVKNYLVNEKGELTASDIIKSGSDEEPNTYGIIIINVAPINAYYDYLEISDITGRELIVFTQVDAEHNRVGVDIPSRDGNGIILNKMSDKTIYVKTLISRNYSSIMHTIQVKAYVFNDGANDTNKLDDICVSPSKINVTARMMPNITMNYIRPDGSIEREQTTKHLAIGTVNDFLIYATNADSAIPTFSYSLSKAGAVDLDFNDYFIELSSNTNFYQLTPRQNANFRDLLGYTLTITATATATNENGDFDTTSKSLSFTFVNFVVHNVSISHSVNNGSTLYGNYGVDIDFYFYFDSNDISFYGNDGNNIYYDSTITSKEQGTIYYINEILKNLNSSLSLFNFNEFISENEDSTIEIDTTNSILTLKNNGIEVLTIKNNRYTYTINVTGNEEIDSMNIIFFLDVNEFNWSFASEDAEKQSNNTQLKYDLEYGLSFTNALTNHETNLIVTAEEFLNMESGTGYTLGQDITLENYTPLDLNLTYFDGNGHTITIKNFSTFADANIMAGLFEQVYEGMRVENLEVHYSEGDKTGFGTYKRTSTSFDVTYYDITKNSEVDYESVIFGGITPSNSGIITNCKVSGIMALTAPTVEAKVSGLNVAFYIGGLVGNNNSTGYITNSVSELQIFAKANIGGFVYSNAGKIVSSAFDANTTTTVAGTISQNKHGLIYAYNRTNSYTNVIQVSGFAVNNSGEISMSYVESGVTYATLGASASNNNPIGNISAKDVSAGFVYSNSGLVYDSYVLMEQVGDNSNNIFSGFVNSNSASIENCYTMINNGNKSSAIINMFAPYGTTGITNSYEIKIPVVGYTNGINGLNEIEFNNRFDVNQYKTFTFGDNTSAVWTISGTNTPKLVSTIEKVEFNGLEKPDGNLVNIDGVDYYKNYYGLRKITREDNPIYDENGNVVGYNYKWIVSDNGYGESSNPILIYDLNSFETYFIQSNMGAYFRFVSDIDFSSKSANPTTSNLTFSGNIQGNNMRIDGLMIYSLESLESIGLFGKIESADSSAYNSIRNLKVNASSVLASRTQSVGVLAGIIQDYRLYNIELSADDVIVGSNAVGGLAGIVRGRFDIQNITSSVSVNSVRASTQYQYSIYESINNRSEISSNLDTIYYAGSIAGILDGYDSSNYDITKARDLIEANYFVADDLYVSGNITAIGDTVGAMFGLVGERVKVYSASVELSGGILYGYQYSAGLVGENRGWIESATVSSETLNLFEYSNNVNAGIVGFNLGGIILNSSADIVITKDNTSSTAGGIVGRNLNGYINSSAFSGEIISFYAGGIMGADYTYETFINRTSGSGAIDRNNLNVLLENKVEYTSNGIELNQFSDLSISKDSIEYWLDNTREFYSYQVNQTDFDSAINYSKVLGLFVGLRTNGIDYSGITYGLSDYGFIIYPTDSNITNSEVGLVQNANLIGNVQYDLPYANIFTSITVDYTYITYIVGSSVSAFDSWTRNSYDDEMIVFTNSTDISYPFGKVEGFYARGDGNNVYLRNALGELTFDYSYLLDNFIIDEENPLTVSLNSSELSEIEDNIINLKFSSNVCTLEFNGTSATTNSALKITIRISKVD